MNTSITTLLLDGYTVKLCPVTQIGQNKTIGVHAIIESEGRIITQCIRDINGSNDVADVLEEAYNQLEADAAPADNPSAAL